MKKNSVFFIIDDDPDDQELIIKALHQIDEFCSCITAFDGEQALISLQQEMFILPDLIFLDLNMPRMNGKQFLTQIKANVRFHRVPVVVYSTSSEKNEMEELKHLGASFFLQKPNRFSDLFKMLKDLILLNSNNLL